MNVIRVRSMNRLKATGHQSLFLPRGAKILDVCVWHEEIKITVSFNDEKFAPKDEKDDRYEFVLVSADQRFCIDNYIFLGTIVLHYGNDIYHVLYQNEES